MSIPSDGPPDQAKTSLTAVFRRISDKEKTPFLRPREGEAPAKGAAGLPGGRSAPRLSPDRPISPRPASERPRAESGLAKTLARLVDSPETEIDRPVRPAEAPAPARPEPSPATPAFGAVAPSDPVIGETSSPAEMPRETAPRVEAPPQATPKPVAAATVERPSIELGRFHLPFSLPISTSLFAWGESAASGVAPGAVAHDTRGVPDQAAAEPPPIAEVSTAKVLPPNLSPPNLTPPGVSSPDVARSDAVPAKAPPPPKAAVDVRPPVAGRAEAARPSRLPAAARVDAAISASAMPEPAAYAVLGTEIPAPAAPVRREAPAPAASASPKPAAVREAPSSARPVASQMRAPKATLTPSQATTQLSAPLPIRVEAASAASPGNTISHQAPIPASQRAPDRRETPDTSERVPALARQQGRRVPPPIAPAGNARRASPLHPIRDAATAIEPRSDTAANAPAESVRGAPSAPLDRTDPPQPIEDLPASQPADILGADTAWGRTTVDVPRAAHLGPRPAIAAPSIQSVPDGVPGAMERAVGVTARPDDPAIPARAAPFAPTPDVAPDASAAAPGAALHDGLPNRRGPARPIREAARVSAEIVAFPAEPRRAAPDRSGRAASVSPANMPSRRAAAIAPVGPAPSRSVPRILAEPAEAAPTRRLPRVTALAAAAAVPRQSLPEPLLEAAEPISAPRSGFLELAQPAVIIGAAPVAAGDEAAFLAPAPDQLENAAGALDPAVAAETAFDSPYLAPQPTAHGIRDLDPSPAATALLAADPIKAELGFDRLPETAARTMPRDANRTAWIAAPDNIRAEEARPAIGREPRPVPVLLRHRSRSVLSLAAEPREIAPPGDSSPEFVAETQRPEAPLRLDQRSAETRLLGPMPIARRHELTRTLLPSLPLSPRSEPAALLSRIATHRPLPAPSPTRLIDIVITHSVEPAAELPPLPIADPLTDPATGRASEDFDHPSAVAAAIVAREIIDLFALAGEKAGAPPEPERPGLPAVLKKEVERSQPSTQPASSARIAHAPPNSLAEMLGRQLAERRRSSGDALVLFRPEAAGLPAQLLGRNPVPARLLALARAGQRHVRLADAGLLQEAPDETEDQPSSLARGLADRHSEHEIASEGGRTPRLYRRVLIPAEVAVDDNPARLLDLSLGGIGVAGLSPRPRVGSAVSIMLRTGLADLDLGTSLNAQVIYADRARTGLRFAELTPSQTALLRYLVTRFDEELGRAATTQLLDEMAPRQSPLPQPATARPRIAPAKEAQVKETPAELPPPVVEPAAPPPKRKRRLRFGRGR